VSQDKHVSASNQTHQEIIAQQFSISVSSKRKRNRKILINQLFSYQKSLFQQHQHRLRKHFQTPKLNQTKHRRRVKKKKVKFHCSTESISVYRKKAKEGTQLNINQSIYTQTLVKISKFNKAKQKLEI